MTHSMFVLLNEIDLYTSALRKILAEGAKTEPGHDEWFQIGISVSRIHELTAQLTQHCLLHTRDKYKGGMPGIGVQTQPPGIDPTPDDPDLFTTKE